MIGVGQAFGLAIIISMLLLLYIPSITLYALKDIEFYKTLNQPRRILAYIFSFVLFGLLTLLTIRSFPFVSLDWLMIYAFTVTIIVIVNLYNRKKTDK